MRSRPAGAQRVAVRGGGSVTVAIAELVSSGAGVLAVCADASRRAALASGATGLARFNGGSGRIACMRCGGAALDGVAAKGAGGLGLTDYATLERAAGEVAAEFEHVVLIDPPPSRRAEELATSPRGGRGTSAAEPDGTPGFLHRLWTQADIDFSRAVLGDRSASRATIARVFRALRDAGRPGGPQLREALGGGGAFPLAPESAARTFRVLRELDLVAGEPNGGDGAVGVVSSEGKDLDNSAAFRAYRAQHSEALQYLERPKQP
jgi:hypothetical protein